MMAPSSCLIASAPCCGHTPLPMALSCCARLRPMSGLVTHPSGSPIIHSAKRAARRGLPLLSSSVGSGAGLVTCSHLCTTASYGPNVDTPAVSCTMSSRKFPMERQRGALISPRLRCFSLASPSRTGKESIVLGVGKYRSSPGKYTEIAVRAGLSRLRSDGVSSPRAPSDALGVGRYCCFPKCAETLVSEGEWRLASARESPCLQSLALGVGRCGEDEEAFPVVCPPHVANSKACPFRIKPVFGQVSEYSIEPQRPVSGHIFQDCESWS